jgi:hypothetical protein
MSGPGDKKAIDLAAVRRTLAKLDALALKHPELVGGPTDAATAAQWEKELAPILGAEVDTMAAKKSEAKANKDNRSPVMAFRMPVALVARLDWYAKRLADLTGLEVSRTDALKHALGKGLALAAKDFEALDSAKAKR